MSWVILWAALMLIGCTDFQYGKMWFAMAGFVVIVFGLGVLV